MMGCRGVLEVDSPAATLRRAIQAVASGEIWASRRSISRVVQTLLFADRQQMTSRESQILKLIARGYSNREIAEQLFISRETVRWHMRSLYSKIGAHDRDSAVTYARDLERRTATA